MYTELLIKERLLNSQAWLERAIVALYNRQTEDEKTTENTKHTNGCGFSKPDASKMSYYARWILSGKHLTGHHLDAAKNKITKYTKQLTRIANKEL